MDQNINFSDSDQIQNPQYPDVQEIPLTNDEFKAFIKANDDKMNDLEIKFDQFQKQCEQMQDDLLNQMRNFMQNFQNGPPGEDKEHEAALDTGLFSTEDIQPLPVQELPQNSDMHRIIEGCCVEASEEQKQNMEKTMLDLVKICHHKQFLCIHDDVDDLIENNSTPDRVLNSFESDNSLLDNFSPEFETFCDHSKETRSGNTTYANYSLPEYDLFCFEIEPDQERLINFVENDNSDNSSNDPLLEEADLFLSVDSIPPGIENVADDPEGDVRFLEELLINDSILSHELSDDNNPSISRPPPEPPDVEFFFDLNPDVIAEEISDKLNEDKCFDLGREINVSTKIGDNDHFPFMIVIRFFLPYFIFSEVSPLLLSAESEDTIFDPGISD
nr:hypothetical protein [Tanacetum cinerariifolium]